MLNYLDRTLDDNNRRQIDFRQYEVKKVLPAYFQEEYETLIKFLEYYYEYLEQDENVHILHNLYRSRDITQVDTKLLQFIEDELLLGQSYFQGFINKREAAKFSNLLYRSKGSLYSIQQFFRAFFQDDPTVEYTKEKIFKLNDSKIGSESGKFITDDKLYQELAILIKSGIPISTWLDVYKLFVHPGGMYVGGQLELVSANEAIPTRMPELLQNPAEGLKVYNVGFADYGYAADSGIVQFLTIGDEDSALDASRQLVVIEPAANTSTTLIVEGDNRTGGNYTDFRMNINSRITAYGDVPISELTSQQTLETFFDPNSITFDDSTGKVIVGGTDVSARMSDSAVDTTGHILPNGADILPGRVLVAHRFDEDWFRDSPYATTISI